MEDRTLLAALMVMNGNDSGAGSLRDVLANAASGSLIQFAAGVTNVNLATPIQFGIGPNGKPNNVTNVTIDGQNNVTINGQTQTSLFEVTAGSDTINNLKLTEGNGTDGKGNPRNGGAVLVDKGATLSLNNDTLKSNNTIAGSGANGGAIENDGNLNVSACTFDGNTADGSGGAIENTGIVNINGVASTFTGNRAGKLGGAIDSSGSGSLNVSFDTFYGNQAPQGGAISTATNTTLKNDVFGGTGANQPNQATDPNRSGGGAVFANNPAANNVILTVLACQFIDNNSDAIGGGGAITARNFNTDVEQSTFDQNQGKQGSGGGMAVSDFGNKGPGVITHEFNLDTFTNNQANQGGALDISDTASASAVNVFLYNSTFYKNHAVDSDTNPNSGQGGGVHIIAVLSGAGTATDTLTNDTFFTNDSTQFGGALDVVLSTLGTASPSVILTSLTVNNNTAATDGDGLYVSSKLLKAVTLDNSILDGNTVTANPKGAQDVTLANGATLSEQYNLAGTSNNNNFTNGVNNDILSNITGLANQLAANGAPANYPQTLALTAIKGAQSPGYQTGDPNLATSGNPLNKDERGVTRQVGKVSRGAEDPDGKYATAMSINSSVNPALPGQAITLTAAATSVGGVPTGTVTFYDASTELGTSPLDANGNATLTISSLSLGNHSITATYGGDDNFTGSNGSLTQVVSQENGSFISLSSSAPSNPTLNQPITFTVNVSGSSGTPTGSVTFLDGDTVLGSSNLDATGKATFTTSALTLGSHSITAIYAGDASYGSNSATLNQPINQGGVFTSLNVSANPAQPGQPVTFTATLSYHNAAGTPTGVVTFLDGSTVLGTGTLTQVGSQMQATFTTSSLTSGSHAITAVYSGDNVFIASSASTIETIGQSSSASSSISVSASANPALLGQAVTLTTTVTGSSGTPTGSVTFLDGTTVLGTAPLSVVNGQAQASLTFSTWALGYHDIIAVYSGDGTYAGSANTMMLPVNQGGTSTTLTSSANPSPLGQSVTFTATVQAVGMSGATPTGSVSFFDGTTFLGTGTLTLVNGQMQATFTTAALGLGSHRIIAIYTGDSTFADSGASLQQSISS